MTDFPSPLASGAELGYAGVSVADQLHTMLFRAAEQSINADELFHIPGLPDASMKYRGEKVRLNAAEYDRLCELSCTYLLSVAGNMQWNIENPSEIDLKRFRRILSASRIRARRDIMRERS